MIANDDDFDRHNTARHRLLLKKFDPGQEMSPGEVSELAQLQKQCSEYLDAKYPLDFYLLESMTADVEAAAARLDALCDELGISCDP